MRNHKDRQRGGTLLGIIIGLIIGLGIALGVAVTINKTPMPFTNKVARPERNDSNANQAADPNRALYGNKNAAKEAAKALAAKEQAPATAAPAPAPVAEAPAPAPAPAEPAAPAAPQVAERKPEPKAAVIDLSTLDKPRKAEVRSADAKEAVAKTQPAEDKWNYYLQAGAFREQTDAENTRAKLALLGVEARVSERPSENGTLYRVRVGPFAQMDAMNKVRGKLSDNGVDAAIVRVAK